MANAVDLSSVAWILIPARGGSVGIPRKNLRMLGGKPLIAHSIETALHVVPPERVIVVTDDDEIAEAAVRAGAAVTLETELTPPEETLDTKIVRNIANLRERGAAGDDVVVTVQPTSPLLKAESIHSAIAAFTSDQVGSVVSVADDRHLRWCVDETGGASPLFTARVNRQQLPQEFRETGGVIAARLADIESNRTRVIHPVKVLPLSDDEAVDIDTYSDLYAAAHLLSRRRIAIRVDASKQRGMGHVYRMLAFASELARHDLVLYLREDMPLGQEFFAKYPYKTSVVVDHEEFCKRIEHFQPDLVVLDVLDTSAEEIRGIREAAPGAKILTFEDRGPGAIEADLLVAEFVRNDQVPLFKQLAGIDFALLSPTFETSQYHFERSVEELQNILVLFGGTDPSGLAVRALSSLARIGYAGEVTVVRGLGAEPIDWQFSKAPFRLQVIENVKNMASIMSRADLAFTSAGRTIVELAARGVPSICLAQNDKELTHTHATLDNGVLALGLGADLSDEDLDAAVRSMIEDANFRDQLAKNAREAGSRRTNRNTIAAILSKLGFMDFPDI